MKILFCIISLLYLSGAKQNTHDYSRKTKPASVSVPREGPACFNVYTCCKGDAGVFVMKRIEYQKGEKIGNCIYLYDVKPYLRPDGGTERKALFQCICNNKFETVIGHVKRGITTSCGCLGPKYTMSEKTTTHGLSKHPLYVV